jgi:2,3-bisphosphoglycerate-independent phosphoglycerate mutase
LRTALLFIDGVGVGGKTPDTNPLARGDFLLSQFEDGTGTPLPGGELSLVDATFGMAGRPQSASNQTALLTGLPAPLLVGRHVLGYPDGPLRALLAKHSLVKRLVDMGQRATFANAYPAAYLQALGLPHQEGGALDVEISARARRRLRSSASTAAFAAGGVPLRTLDALRAGEAVAHDVTGARAVARGLVLPLRTPLEAATAFWRLAEGMDFTLFEHFSADEAGHAQDVAAALEALGTFDAFIRAVLAKRPDDTRVLVTSDHGNVEDLRTRNHTRAPVPLLAFPPLPGTARPATVADVGQLLLG